MAKNEPLINENWIDDFLNKAADILREDLRKAWKQNRDPETGQKWAPLKHSNGSGKILWRTGELQNDLKIVPGQGKNTLVAEFADYGRFHIDGTERMAQRNFLGVSQDAIEELEDLAFRTLLGD